MNSTQQPSLTLSGICGWALGYALRRWLQLAAVTGAMLLKAGLDVLKPWPMVFLVDYVLQGKLTLPIFAGIADLLPREPSMLIGLAVGATILLFILSWAVGLAGAYAGISLGQRTTYDLAGDLFDKFQQLSLRFHTSKSVGDNIRRVTGDCSCVSVIVKDALVPIVSALITLAAMFAIMWRINPVLTLLAVAVVPYMILVFRKYAPPMMDRSYEQQEVEGEIYSVVEQTFSAIPVVQAFGREDLNDRRIHEAHQRTLDATLALTVVQLKFRIMMGLATAAGTAAVFWIGARYALGGELTVGAIILFLSYLGSLYGPLESVMYTGSTIQGSAGSARRVLEVLHAEADIADRPGAVPLKNVQGRVRMENVTFGYTADRAVLAGVSLEAAPGETIALVGPTGAGKTTLVSLIPRFFDPREGRVLLDGCDVRDAQLRSLRQNIAIVLQEPFLFPISIAENIAYGRPSATRADIEAAARAANAHEFIQRLPHGYDTVIGERGASLSGGERQRVSIARAFLKDAPVLILDEPTSALDAETEQLLLEALARLTKGRTTFIIAHRLSTVRHADRIIVLEDGRIVESGTHAQLLKEGRVYARFHELQFGAQKLETA
jgi:ATP-binding cassette, subfamily B, bacterial